MRGVSPGTAGSKRIVSLRTAGMYLSFCTLRNVISSSEAKAERISSVNWRRTSGWVHNKNVAADKVVAVVSEPAIMKLPELIWISSKLSFYWRVSFDIP